ncbi:MAG: hypothetical protein ACPGVB_08070 [Chitinophagales bacterium]
MPIKMSDTIDFLHLQWLQLFDENPVSESIIAEHWQNLVKHYQESHRHYHNLTHLQELFKLLLPLEQKLEHPKAVYFAIFYHDIIYNSLRKDNELKSAEYADKVLPLLKVDTTTIQLAYSLILATKDHEALLPTNDFRYFLDADLAILGADWGKYELYSQAIRKEYRHVPSILYRRGRRKVLQHLLQKSPLYYTPEFFERFEVQARENVRMELEKL